MAAAAGGAAARRRCGGRRAAREHPDRGEARRRSMLLSVTDHGPGIPEADRKHAIERFVRLEASRTPARIRTGLEPGVGGRDAAWRRAQAQRRASRTARDAGDPGGRQVRDLRLKRRMCNTRRHDLIRERATRTDIVWPRGSWTDRICPLLLKPSSVLKAGSPILSRSSRLRSVISPIGFPASRPFCSSVAEASPYLFDLIRADPARAIRLFGCDPDSHLAALIEQTTSSVASGRQRSRRDATAAPHEIGSGASDRAV